MGGTAATRLLQAILEQLLSTQNQANVKRWEAVSHSLERRGSTGQIMGGGRATPQVNSPHREGAKNDSGG